MEASGFVTHLSIAAVHSRLGVKVLLLQLPGQSQLLPVWAQHQAGGAAEGGGGRSICLKL